MVEKLILCLEEKELEEILKKSLEIALKVWNYRIQNKGNPYGIEYIFQTYLAHKAIAYFGSSYSIYVSQSLKQVVKNNENYSKHVEVFKAAGNKYVQPDLTVVKGHKILEILEIKCIEDGQLQWVFSGDGRKKNKCKGDICRLARIKKEFSEICAYELIINRGNWDSSQDWGRKYYNELVKLGILQIKKEGTILGRYDLQFRLVEVLRPDSKVLDELVNVCDS